MQWEKAPMTKPTPRVDTEERSKGGPISDPTADIVGDERRLAVRAEVQRAESLVRRARLGFVTITRGLDRAVRAWEGDTD